MSERAKAKQIQVEASEASTAGTLQELIEGRKIFRPADIDVTPGEYDVVIESSTGTPGTIPAATVTKAGAMSKDDKAKVNDLPDAAGLAAALDTKVDKVPGSKLITDDQATKLDELPDNAALGVALGNKVDKVPGSKLITDGQATKLDELPDSAALSASLGNKVDKVPGEKLITDAQALKLDELPDNAALGVALGNKVDKVPGSKLITDDQATKLDDLPERSELDLSLDNKVDKEPGRSLVDDGDALKLADLPTAAQLGDALDAKVDAEAGKGLIHPSPLVGGPYGQKDGVWVEIPAGGDGGASALGDLSDVTLGTLADGEVLAWDDTEGKWVNKVSQGGAAALAELTDVDFGTPADGQVLTYDAATQKSKFADASGFDPETPVLWGVGAAGDTGSVSLGAGATSTSESIAIGEGATSLAYESVVIGKGAEVLFGGSPFAAQGMIALGPGTKSGGVALGYFGCQAGVHAVAIGGGGDAMTPIPTKAGGFSISIGMGAAAPNISSISVGRLAEAKQASSIAIGHSATANAMYSVALGEGSTAASLYEIRLGGPDAIVKTQSDIVVVSDERDKADIQEHNLGLDFINLLTPVKWKSDPREAYAPREEDFETYEEYRLAKESWDPSSVVKDGSRKGKRFKYGLIAQQVKEAMDVLGTDFSGYVDDSVTAGGAGNKALAYTDFISPLILAVQQLSSMVKDLEQEVRDLREAAGGLDD